MYTTFLVAFDYQLSDEQEIQLENRIRSLFEISQPNIIVLNSPSLKFYSIPYRKRPIQSILFLPPEKGTKNVSRR